MTPTRRTLLRAGLATAATSLTLPAYATLVEPWLRLRIARYAPAPPNWPADLPLTIAVLTDIHAGEPQMSLARIEAIVAATNALNPDLIVLLGDYAISRRFVTRHVAPPDLARALAGLRAPLGTHAILGNHDWWEDPEAKATRRGPTRWGRALMEAGIAVLQNDALRLPWRGRRFWLLGLGDTWAFGWNRAARQYMGADDLDRTLAPLAADDAPAILLAHEPDIFPRVPARVALTLAGHTHGGQVRVFGWSPRIPSIYGDRYVHGHIVEEGRHLIVSAGLGTTALPVRFNVPPEIVLARLGAPASA